MRQLKHQLKRHLEDLRKKGELRFLETNLEPSFTTNDYLGLRRHPAIVEGATRAARDWGAGSGGSRLLGGHHRWFDAAEEAIAAYFRAPSALLFSTGYLAAQAAAQAVAPLCDGFLSDQRNHASWIDGLRLTGKPRVVLPHESWRAPPTGVANHAIVAETLYGMDGDLVDLEALKAACDRQCNYLLLDEAHAAGVFGPRGRGWGDRWRDWDRQIVLVTFGKAFGAGGAALLTSPAMRQWIVNTARAFIFSTAPSPAVVGAIVAAAGVVSAADAARAELHARARRLRERLAALPLAHQPRHEAEWASPVVAVLAPGAERALRLAEGMRDSGFGLRAIRYPTVARGTERLRISVTRNVDASALERMAEELERQWTASSSPEPTRT